MTPTSYFFGIAVAVLLISVISMLLLKRRLRERHALWWLIIGGIALIVAIFPNLLEIASQSLGILLQVSLVFFVGIIMLIITSIQHSAEITDLEEKCRLLAEQNALLSYAIKDLSQDADHSQDK